jgi:ectoine hydroxylase-related dioxygenase (phytanoyl-CoA dioxygenase family)
MNVIREKVLSEGFAIVPSVYSTAEITQLLAVIDRFVDKKDDFNTSANLFAIRKFLKEIPAAHSIIFNEKLKALMNDAFGNGYFVVKSIYFDKPKHSNWFVAYHQDLTISVDQKIAMEQFVQWTIKQDQFSVQPPIHYLENNFTIRIHLDDTDENNGALKVIPGAHLKGICNPAHFDFDQMKEVTCAVPTGGVMLMKPLLWHRSNRSTSQHRRRVIHIEFSNQELPGQLNWAEKMEIDRS